MYKINHFSGNKYTIDPEKEVDYLISWIKDIFADYGENTKAVIGMSGGKDSTITAALLKEAIGGHRVYGIIMPDNTMADKELATEICKHLGILHSTVNIGDITESFYDSFELVADTNPMVRTNTPARIRMSMLYAIAATCHGRVVNTCNASESYIGWATKWGDTAGDFSILSEYPVRFVKMIGYELVKRGLIKAEWVDKIPDDGMCGYSDEEKFGFTYEELDEYLINKISPDVSKLTKIKEMHKQSTHKENSIRLPCPNIFTEHKEDTLWIPEVDIW